VGIIACLLLISLHVWFKWTIRYGTIGYGTIWYGIDNKGKRTTKAFSLKVETFFGLAVMHIEDNRAIWCMCVQFVLHYCLLTWLSYRFRKFIKSLTPIIKMFRKNGLEWFERLHLPRCWYCFQITCVLTRQNKVIIYGLNLWLDLNYHPFIVRLLKGYSNTEIFSIFGNSIQ